jgi:aryl-alcohol dehydrogenase-like predicted oxidoreductase
LFEPAIASLKPDRLFFFTTRLQGENFEANRAAVQRLKDFARQKGYTPGQVALAWLHCQGDDVFPIPGTKKASRLEENARAVTIKLSRNELNHLTELVPEAKGERYEGMAMTWNVRASR